MTETQRYEVTEKGGKGWFFFALIPGALAGALLMWLAFYTGVIDWQKAQRIEGRMDNRVGVNGQLTAPVDLIIRKSGCLNISRAYLDSGALTVYLTNGCPENLDYWEVHWSVAAPDGTIIQQGYTNHTEPGNGTGIQANSTLEVKPESAGGLAEDGRAAKVVVWASLR